MAVGKYDESVESSRIAGVAAQARKVSAKLGELLAMVESKEGDAQLMAAGNLAEIGQDFAGAARWYERALELDPSNDDALARLALVRVKLNQVQSAVEAASTLAMRSPEFTFTSLMMDRPLSAMTVLGNALEKSGDDEAAARAFNQAVSLQEDDAYSVGSLGVLLVKEGKISEAVEQFDKLESEGSAFAPVASAARLAIADPALAPAAQAVAALADRAAA
ncbi:MAG: tetratricopeptide repeat protein [Erythrobacter sp.]|nr:tetratricopeptide repeat protein [Erythrobacter sp.]